MKWRFREPERRSRSGDSSRIFRRVALIRESPDVPLRRHSYRTSDLQIPLQSSLVPLLTVELESLGAFPSMASRISFAFEASPLMACTNCAIAQSFSESCALAQFQLAPQMFGKRFLCDRGVPFRNRVTLWSARRIARHTTTPRFEIRFRFLTDRHAVNLTTVTACSDF